MKNFKISHFVQEYPGQSFPWFRTLSAGEARQIRRRLAEKLGISPDIDALALTERLLKRTLPCGEPNAEDDAFHLQETVARVGIIPLKTVYVNWYRYDQIDEMYFEELAQYFDNIWYPSSDDIELFDSTCSWLIAISHNGDVLFTRLD